MFRHCLQFYSECTTWEVGGRRSLSPDTTCEQGIPFFQQHSAQEQVFDTATLVHSAPPKRTVRRFSGTGKGRRKFGTSHSTALSFEPICTTNSPSLQSSQPDLSTIMSRQQFEFQKFMLQNQALFLQTLGKKLWSGVFFVFFFFAFLFVAISSTVLLKVKIYLRVLLPNVRSLALLIYLKW